MANLVELSNQLEDFPEQQLVQMSQDPNSMYPSYLVLSEIQRRNQMRKMYEAQQPKPETTVAEEVIGEFTGQQGLQGAMAQSPGPQNAFPPSDMGNMAPPSPMQMMADGGLTGYDGGGKTKFPLLEAKSKVTKEQNKQILNRIADARTEKFGAAGKMSNLGDRAFSIIGGSGNNIRLNPTEEKLYIQLANEMIDKKAGGGRTGYQVGGSPDLSGTFSPTGINPYPIGSDNLSGTIEERALIAAGINPQGMKSEDIKNTYNLLKQDYQEKNPGLGSKAFEFMYGEELGDEFMDYVSSVPIGGLAVKGLQKGLPMIPKAYKGLKNYFKKAKTKETKLPDVKVKGGGSAPGGVMIETLEQAGPGRKFIQPIINNPIKSSLVATPILGGINQLTGEPEIEPNINNEDTTKSTEQLEIDRLNALLAETRNKDSKTVDTSKDRRNADMLVGLGGAIGSAKNLGELSSNISDAYFGVQSKRDAKDLAGLQGRLLEAQTAKYEADISGLSVGRLEFLITNLSKQIEEGAFSSDEERNTAIKQRDDLIKAYAAATGYASLDAKNQRNKNLGLEGLIKEVG